MLVKLKTHFSLSKVRRSRTPFRLKSSTLVEVLVAMIILMTVFAIGMMIFANITKSNRSSQHKTIRMQMRELALRSANDSTLNQQLSIDAIDYYIESSILKKLDDRKLIKVYAKSHNQAAVRDSLLYISN